MENNKLNTKLKINDRFFIIFQNNKLYLYDSRDLGTEYSITDYKYIAEICHFLQNNEIKDKEVLDNFINSGFLVANDYKDPCYLGPINQLSICLSQEDSFDHYNEKFKTISKEDTDNIFINSVKLTIKNKKAKNIIAKEIFAHKREKVFFKLTKPNKINLEKSFYEVLKNRKTYRVFKDEQVSSQAFSNVMFHSFGPFHGYETDFPVNFFRRSSPNNGGLRNIQPYIINYNINGLKRGIYSYDDANHEVHLIEDKVIAYDEMMKATHMQPHCVNSSFIIVLAADFQRQTWKYGSMERNLKVLLIDIGCLVQNIQLICTSEKLQTWITGAMDNKYISNRFKFNVNQKLALFMISVGKSEETYDLKSINKCYEKVGVKGIYNSHKKSILED